MGRKKGKAKSGTWFTREMACSRAFVALSSTAKVILIQFLLKRDMDNNHNVINKNSITMTYKELENLFGEDAFGKKGGGLPRSSISRGFDDLLAKGFIRVVRLGGAYQKDKTVFGLSDDWKHWYKGTVFNKRQKGNKPSTLTYKNNFNPQAATHTHPQSETLNTDFRVAECNPPLKGE